MSAALGLARIGPNATTPMAAARQRRLGREPMREMLATAGLAAYVETPPAAMVDELEVITLHNVVRARLSADVAREVAADAGRHTADYLLAHRIPPIVQAGLRALPAAVSSRLLLRAIGRHAWTFAGGGRFTALPGRRPRIIIGGCAICCGVHAKVAQCDYYAATFSRLFGRLVDARARVTETACIAAGDRYCRFDIDW